MITDGERVILQHRAPWTHEGGRWGIPGGARDAGESAVNAALREAAEEAGLSPEHIEPFGIYVSDHGGWSYSTVMASPGHELHPSAYNAESVAVEWVDRGDVAGLPLHDGFAQAWPQLRDLLHPLFAFVGPDVARQPRVRRLQKEGVAADRIRDRVRVGALERVLLRVVPVRDAVDAADRIAGLPGPAQSIVLMNSADLDALV